MIMKMYSIKDELNGFGGPIPFMSEEIAERWFKTNMIENVNMKNNPKDYSLWYMGTFDTESGTYICKAADIKLIQRGENYGD